MSDQAKIAYILSELKRLEKIIKSVSSDQSNGSGSSSPAEVIAARGSYSSLSARLSSMMQEINKTVSLSELGGQTQLDGIGYVKVLGNNISYVDETYLNLDQTTPQSIINGSPIIEGLQFSTSPTTTNAAEGLLRWNSTDGTLDLGMSGGDITLQIGQEMHMKVRNPSGGSTILNGQVVYISGRTGVFPDIALARADSINTACVIGIATQDIESPAFGYVTTMGYVRGIKTDYSGDGDWGTTWNEGDTLYVSKTVAGQVTNVEPDNPHHSDVIGSVGVVSSNNGSILVNINRHKKLTELSDVDGTPLTVTGQIPVWDNTRKLFDFTSNILTQYVPYTGANANVDLNTRTITTTGSISGGSLLSTGYGSTGSLVIGRGAGGTLASPTASAANQYLLFFGARGYTTDFLNSSQGVFGIKAAELFSATNQGTYCTVETTKIGTTDRKETARFFDDGKVGLFAPQTVSGLPYSTFGRARLHLYDDQSAGDVAMIIGNSGNSTDTVPTASLKFRLRDIVTDIGDSALIQAYKIGTYASAATRSAGLKIQLETADTLANALDIKSTGLNIGTSTYNGWDALQANGYVSGTRFRTPSSWLGTTSLRFGGNTGIVTISEIAELNAVTTFTYSTWVTQDSVTNTDTLFSKPTATASSNSLRINRNSSTTFNVQIHNGATAAYGTFNPQTYFTAGRLHHLVAVFDGAGATNADRLKVYIDKVEIPLTFTQTIPAVTNDNTGLAATISQASTLAWLGNIKDTRIFSTALSAADVATLYETDYTTAMVHQWKLNEGGGLVATDTGSNPVNGVISGDCTWSTREDLTVNRYMNPGRINLPVGTTREDGIFWGRDAYLHRSGTAALRTDASFGVGLSPTSKFHVSQTDNTTTTSAARIQRTASTGNFLTSLLLGAGGTGDLRFSKNSTGQNSISSWATWDLVDQRWEAEATTTVGANQMLFGTSTGILFKTAASAAVTAGDPITFNDTLTLTPAGNVVVGAATATQKFEVNTLSSGALTVGTLLRNLDSTANAAVSLRLSPSTTASRYAEIQAINDGSNNVKLSFLTGSSATITEKLQITPTGKIGMGFVPTAMLHLAAGSASAYTAPLKFSSGPLLTTPETGVIEFLTARFYIRNDKLTVGTTTLSPAAKFEVYDASGDATGGGIQRFVTNSGTNDVGFKMGGVAGATTSGYLWIQGIHPGVANDGNICLNPLGGNVAIGNILASAKAHIIATTEQLRVGYDASNYLSLTVGSANAVTIANAVAADININCGTDKTVVLTETVYDDMQFPILTGKIPVANAPTWETFTTNTEAYAFTVDDRIQLQAAEPPHGWKEGTNGSAHVHFAIKTGNTTGSDRYAKFELIFAYADYNGIWTEQAAITQEQTISTGTSALQNYIVAFSTAVNLSGLHIGSQIRCRLKRIAATGGTEYGDKIYITQVGLHIEKDTIGSRTVSSK